MSHTATINQYHQHQNRISYESRRRRAKIQSEPIGKATASPESPASDTKSAATAGNQIPIDDPSRKDSLHSLRTKRHPGDRRIADPSGSQSGDPARAPNLPAERAAVALQNTVQSAHADDCQELTAQNKTPVLTGVYANPDKRCQPLSEYLSGEDRIRTCGGLAPSRI